MCVGQITASPSADHETPLVHQKLRSKLRRSIPDHMRANMLPKTQHYQPPLAIPYLLNLSFIDNNHWGLLNRSHQNMTRSQP